MSKMETITVTVRQIREQSIAVADGTMGDFRGEEREKYFFLPLSLITVDPPEYEIGQEVEVTLPAWKAREVGLA
jgi:hypothetical protein